MAAAVTAARRGARAPRRRGNRLRRRRRQGPEEPVRVAIGCYDFIKPMKTVGVVAPRRREEGHRDRRAVRRRRGDRAVDQPDVHGDLQDPDRHQGPLRDGHQPASVGGALHHARRGNHERGGASGRRPDGAIGWMTTVTLEGTQELMKQREVAVILATGGMGLVRAAYSAGKPAYGVGPGNAPCYIESSADLRRPRPTSSRASASTTACSAPRRTPSSSTKQSRKKRGGSSRRMAATS